MQLVRLERRSDRFGVNILSLEYIVTPRLGHSLKHAVGIIHFSCPYASILVHLIFIPVL